MEAAKVYLNEGKELTKAKQILKISIHINSMDKDAVIEFMNETKTINLKGEVI